MRILQYGLVLILACSLMVNVYAAGQNGESFAAVTEDVPLLFQWDKRWGDEPYGSGQIGDTGCGPTSLSMVTLYFTEDPEYTPSYMAQYAQKNGYYIWGEGTAWSLFEKGCTEFGLESENVSVSESAMKEELDEGSILICSMRPGDFTNGGHLIVVKGYDEEGFLVNDPNSASRSSKTWEEDIFIPQVRKVWGFQLQEEE